MPAAEITAAIITSIAAAGSTAASTAAALAKTEDSGVSGTIINESSHTFNVFSYEPNHGHWMDHPSLMIHSAKDILKILIAEAETHYDKSNLSETELLTYYHNFYKLKSADGAFVRSAVTSFEIRGAGRGSEGMVVLTTPTSSLVTFLMVRKRPLRNYGAGCKIDLTTRAVRMDYLPEQDDEGENVIAEMKSETGNFTKFSEGLTKIIRNGSIEVRFAGGQSTEFVITDPS